MCDTCDWEEMLDTIEDLASNDDADFALSTIEGIQAWVDEHHHITPKQKTAIANIEAAMERKAGL